jgi:uncharacterized protein (DUF2336 family)
MGAAFSQIPELESVVRHGSREKRAETLRRITALFLADAERYNEAHVALFDSVFGLLLVEIEAKTLAELSSSLAPVPNAPAGVLRRLANDDDIEVARPVLELARSLPEPELIKLANTKGQAHLQAISVRPILGEAVTDVLVRRGDRDVARRVASNHGARISEAGFTRLIQRAEHDGVLAERVGMRHDVPEPLFRELLTKATAVVRERLLAAADPPTRATIRSVLEKVAKEVGKEVSARVRPGDYREAQRLILGLERTGDLDEAALAAFCERGQYEEMVVALAGLAKVPIPIADRLFCGDQPDAILILCKAAGLGWPTVKAIMMARPDAAGTSSQGLDAAYANYGRLSASTAQRVTRFWQMRPKV